MFLRNCELGKYIFWKILTGMSPRKRDTWYWAHISLIPDANPRSVPCSALETAWTEDMLQFPATQSHKRNRTGRFLPRNCVYLTLQSALRGIILYYISASGLWISVSQPRWSQQHTWQAWSGMGFNSPFRCVHSVSDCFETQRMFNTSNSTALLLSFWVEQPSPKQTRSSVHIHIVKVVSTHASPASVGFAANGVLTLDPIRASSLFCCR